MSAPFLLLRKLAIRRLAGLGDSGFTLDDLSPGINLIVGPNGVGKSRTAWAINLALWPAALATPSRDAVAAWFDIGSESWSVDIDGDAIRHQQSGIDAPAPPPLAAASERDRYNLALAELLGGSGESFAAAIARESAGGYDLAAAAADLDIARKPTARRGTLTTAVQEAAAAVRKCEQRGAELRDDESTLEKLLRDRQSAREAIAQAAKLQAALDLADARLRQQQADAALASFPGALATMTGQELPLLRQLRHDRDALANEAADLARQRHETITALSTANLDDESAAAADTAPTALAQASRRLADLANQILIQRKTIDAAQARQETARAALGQAVLPEQLAHLDLAKLAALAAATRECESAQVHFAALEEQHVLLIDPADSPGPEAEVSRLETANFLLTSWLSEPDAQPAANPRGEWIVIAAAACVVILALLLAWRVHWALAGAALVGPLLYWLWRRQMPAPAPGAVRPTLQSQYATLAIDPPPQWTTDAVRATSRSISQSLAAAQLRRQRTGRRTELQPKLAAAREQCQRFTEQRQALAQTLGAPIPTDSISLNALTDALHSWRAADESAKSAHAELRSLQAERDSLFAAAAGTALRFGYTAADVHQLEAATDTLRRRIEQHRAHRQRLCTLDAQANDNARRAAEIQRRIDSLFQTLGLANESDEPALQAYAAQRPDFESARKSATIAAARVAELSSTVDPQLINHPRADLAADLQSATAIAATEGNLTEQIVRIQTEVDNAKRGHALEEAEANRREAAAILAADRDAKCAQIAGWALVEHLRQATRERNRPAVFRAAREIFARITRGRYRLEFDAPTTGKAAANFVAIDSQTNIGQPLDQLSAGTRVQLLLAVRVAFVEQQERGPRLPLLLDETLANSDETRARQVIDAVIEIARSGRQIFYFTAQVDEIGKWREILQPDPNQPPLLDCKFIDLAAVRGLAATQRTPLRQLITIPAQTVPSPESVNNDRIAYGKLLAVPGIDPQNDSPAPVHLWHLIDDLHLLHRLLSRGITTWGQLQTMRDYAEAGDDGDAPVLHRAQATAKMLTTLSRLWRIGRGRPLDRQALADAPVTPQIRPAMAAVAESVAWDPRALLNQLEAGAVPRFGEKKIEQLRQYLEETGCIDPRQPLAPDELRIAAISALQRELDAHLLSVEQIETARQTWFSAPPQTPASEVTPQDPDKPPRSDNP